MYEKSNMNSFDESEKEKKPKVCCMENHKENEINNLTSQFSYFELSLVSKKLNNESSKIKGLDI